MNPCDKRSIAYVNPQELEKTNSKSKPYDSIFKYRAFETVQVKENGEKRKTVPDFKTVKFA